MDYVREGDIVVVWKLDRLGRDLMHILETVKALTARDIAKYLSVSRATLYWYLADEAA